MHFMDAKAPEILILFKCTYILKNVALQLLPCPAGT